MNADSPRDAALPHNTAQPHDTAPPHDAVLPSGTALPDGAALPHGSALAGGAASPSNTTLDSNTSSPRNTTLTRQAALPLRWKSTLLLIVVSLAGLAMFLWPLFTSADPADFQHALDAPFVFAALIPLLIVLVLAQLAEGGLDVKALALLGVLSAVNAVLRPLGAGVGGIETVGFLLIVAGRVFGPGFGFALGCTSLFASALLTAGVGPWLPYQMLSCAWIGLGAGLLPDRLCGRAVRGWAETALLAFYGIAAAYGFGFLMNMWFWPFAAGASGGALAYIPGGALLDNLHRFVSFTLVTSTALWDTGRAITDLVAVLVLGRPVLGLLRRASRKASFDAVADFTP